MNNKTMRGLIFVVLVVASGMALLVGNARGADEAMPPEVKALIGTKIPPKVKNHTPADHIPNFISREWALIDDRSDRRLAYTSGYFLGKWPVIIIERIYRDKTIEILDAHLLPENQIEWQFINGEFKDLDGRYRIGFCRIAGTDNYKQIILGLVQSEKNKTDCSHFSRHVKSVWKLDQEDGHLIAMSTKNVQCNYETLNSCY